MPTFQVFQAFNGSFPSVDTSGSPVLVHTPAEFSANAANYAIILMSAPGDPFTYNGNNELIGGTIQSLEYDANGPFLKISDVAWKSTELVSDLSQRSGNWTFIGSPGNDVLGGFGANDTITGGGGNDTLAGGSGDSIINAGPGNDLIVGLSGNDLFNGYAGNDTILGGSGNDTINGGPGSDNIASVSGNSRLNGDAGNDTILAGSGNDTMNGGAGNDLLAVAGSGNDRLTGGPGHDRFYFVPNIGHDVITDFTHGEDKIGIPHLIFANVGSVKAHSHVDLLHPGHHVVIELGDPSHTITLDTIHHVKDLTKADFV